MFCFVVRGMRYAVRGMVNGRRGDGEKGGWGERAMGRWGDGGKGGWGLNALVP